MQKDVRPGGRRNLGLLYEMNGSREIGCIFFFVKRTSETCVARFPSFLHLSHTTLTHIDIRKNVTSRLFYAARSLANFASSSPPYMRQSENIFSLPAPPKRNLSEANNSSTSYRYVFPVDVRCAFNAFAVDDGSMRGVLVLPLVFLPLVLSLPSFLPFRVISLSRC